ncbi:hypothetical protein [Planomicrobium sp. CPCC 101079]|uniref:hypothetical protein n=1 Tax=Planomicrobium sp. CPCC 101079 TaxID=2599618 RepID=UPI0011B5AFC4|nr:hypothetical protein [Planomicrobium sp. CPCC 101079]TWT04596.1 hypothetical protein FQV28_08310 [Planomicrobium sp. CPCC 101079]
MASWGDLYRVEPKEVDWTNKRIQPYIEFKMPDEFKQRHWKETDYFFTMPNQSIPEDVKKHMIERARNGWLSYPLGVFLVSTPTKREKGISVVRDIEAYDKLLILKEDKIIDRLTFAAGRSYYDCMIEVLNSAGQYRYIIENNDKKLPTAKEYEPGTEKLLILNDLASDLNFTPFFVDEYGFYQSKQYKSPQESPEYYVYEDNGESVVIPGLEETLDTFNLPNVFVVIATNPDTDTVLKSTFVNDNPEHPLSTVNLGRRVVRVEEKDDIADQETLDSYVERIAFEASQIYGKVTFSTALMPFHGYSNVLVLKNRTLGIDAKYAETDWTMPLKAGASMSHEARKVVSLT